MRISETKLSSVIFIAAAIALLTFWASLWAVMLNFNLKDPGTFAFRFLLFNFVIAAVFLSSLKPLSSDGRVEDEMNRVSQVVEIEEGMNDADDDDGCDGGSECCEGDVDYVVVVDDDDDIDPADLEKKADEFIAKMKQGWMEEKINNGFTSDLKLALVRMSSF